MLLIEQTVVTLQELELSEGFGVGFGGSNRGFRVDASIGKVNTKFGIEIEFYFGVNRVKRRI